MRRGLCLRRTDWGSRFRVARTLGRKGSIRMSLWGRRERRREWEGECLRLRQMEDLWVVRRSGVGGGGVAVEDGVGGMGLDWVVGGGE